MLTFHLNQTGLSLGAKLPRKGIFPIQKRKFEHHHWIQHIPINLSTKYHIKQTVLNF